MVQRVLRGIHKIDPTSEHRKRLFAKYRPPFDWLKVCQDPEMSLQAIQIVLVMEYDGDVAKVRDPDTLMSFLVSAGRWDLVEELSKTRKYTKAAKIEIQQREFMNKRRQMEEIRVAALPPPIREINDTIRRVWMRGGATFPSAYAIQHGLGDHYLALTLDGTLVALFEVLSLDGDGLLQFAELKLSGAKEMPPGCPGDWNKKIQDWGIRHRDELTFPQLLGIVELLVEYENSKVNSTCEGG